MTDIEPRFVGHYRFERDDYLALTAALRRKNAWYFRIVLLIAWIAIVVLIIGLMSSDWTQFVGAMGDLVTMHEVPLMFYIVIGIVPALLLLMPQMSMLRAMRLYSSLAVADRDIEIKIDEAGLRTSSPGREARMDWSVVRAMIVTDRHLFLPVSGREAIVVPRRAFADDAQFAALLQLVRTKVPTTRAK
jgi:hypothetical protein